MVKKALLIGINYKGSDAELRGCINDIIHIKNILINNCDFNNDNIKVLTEEQTDLPPTRGNIEQHIHLLTSELLPGDILFFYYSGHGSYITDLSGDETDKQDEVLVPLDYEKSGMITDDWLYLNMISKIPSGVNLWGFVDSCHSGTMVDLKYNYKSMCQYTNGSSSGITYNPKEWSNRFSFSIEKSKNVAGSVCFFSGCQDSEVSADAYIENTYQGAFSYCLIELLKNNMIKISDGSFKFKNNSIKLRHMLKEINARLDINGFVNQNTQLSLSKPGDFEKSFNL